MSQTGQIISIRPLPLPGTDTDWVVDFTYQLDAGGTAQSRVIVGSDIPPLSYSPYPNGNPPLVTFWSSPTATITVSPNPPGTSNPVVLPCPDLIKAAAFGISITGIPFR